MYISYMQINSLNNPIIPINKFNLSMNTNNGKKNYLN